MGLFFPEEKDYFPGIRKVGFARYKEILEENWKAFIIVGFITLVFMIPFAGGMVYAALSKSSAVALASGVIGGAVAGPGIACMYDLILRRLRDDKSDWWFCYKKAFKNNWKSAIFPGIVMCVFLGMTAFGLMLMYWGATPPSIGTIALMLLGALAVTMVLTVWWSQVVLFDQKISLRLKNTLFFILFHLGKNILSASIQVVWWLVIFLFMPWTAFVLPFLSVWYILFLSVFIIYRPLDDDFRIEEQIRQKFPGTLPEEGNEQ